MITQNQLSPQIPKGWELLTFDAYAPDPRDVLVLCQRKDHEDDLEYVTWRCNTIEGGCHLGHYFGDEQKAQINYSIRRAAR